MDVTVLMFSSVGAKAVRAMRSHSIQNTPPPKNVAGMTTSCLYTHLRAHETDSYLVCRLLLEKKNK